MANDSGQEKKAAPKRKGAPGLVEQLRDTIVGSGMSLTQISKACGIDSGTLSRFVRGARTITLPAAERILRALHKRVVIEDEPAGKVRGPRAKEKTAPARKPKEKRDGA